MRNRFTKENVQESGLKITQKMEGPSLFRGKPVVNFETLLFLIQQSSGTWCTQYLAAGLSTQSSVQRTLARLYKGSSCISVSKIMKFCKYKSVKPSYFENQHAQYLLTLSSFLFSGSNYERQAHLISSISLMEIIWH